MHDIARQKLIRSDNDAAPLWRFFVISGAVTQVFWVTYLLIKSPALSAIATLNQLHTYVDIFMLFDSSID